MSCKNIYANIIYFIAVISRAVVLVTATAASCGKYSYSLKIDNHSNHTNIHVTESNIQPIQSNIQPTESNKVQEPLDKSWLFEIPENGMTLFCKAIEAGDYNKLQNLLDHIGCYNENKEYADKVIYLIAGYSLSKKKQQGMRSALLAQVITKDTLWQYRENVLDRLFKIVIDYMGDLYKTFIQTHNKKQNTILHLAVDKSDSELVEYLVNFYQNHSNGFNSRENPLHALNREKLTPLLLALDILNEPIKCTYSRPSESCGCVSCYGGMDIKHSQINIIQYLLDKGGPWCKSMFQEGDKTTCYLSILHSLVQHSNLYQAKGASIRLENIIKNITNENINTEKYLANVVENGLSLLSHVVMNHNYPEAEYLIKLGICPMQVDGKDVFPLFYALAYADTKMVECLLQAPCIVQGTCNINQKCKGVTAWDLAYMPSSSKVIINVLVRHCQKLSSQYGEELLSNRWNWDPKDQIIKLVKEIYTKAIALKNNPPLGHKRRRSNHSFDEGYVSSSSPMNLNQSPSVFSESQSETNASPTDTRFHRPSSLVSPSLSVYSYCSNWDTSYASAMTPDIAFDNAKKILFKKISVL